MDYILFHSQYSPSSKKLLHDFPAISEKAVSVDSGTMRAYVKRLHIVCVPTLIITLNNRIIDRVVGYEKIYDWIMVTLYRANQLQPITSNEPLPDESSVPTQNVSQNPPTPNDSTPDYETVNLSHQTNLDDLILVDDPPLSRESESVSGRTEPKVQMNMGGSTLQLAEALKKERDNDLETNKKRLS